jgi:hypothetical protein
MLPGKFSRQAPQPIPRTARHHDDLSQACGFETGDLDGKFQRGSQLVGGPARKTAGIAANQEHAVPGQIVVANRLRAIYPTTFRLATN